MVKSFPMECKHIIKDNYYCTKCGTLCHNNVSKNIYIIIIVEKKQLMAARHFKYCYKSEIPPKTILSKMLEANIDDSYNNNNKNESNRMNLNIERNKFYFSRRKEIKFNEIS